MFIKQYEKGSFKPPAESCASSLTAISTQEAANLGSPQRTKLPTKEVQFIKEKLVVTCCLILRKLKEK